MIAHNVKLSVFCKPEEDFDKTMSGFKALLPFNPEDEKASISIVNAESFQDKTIRIIEAVLDKQRHINAFLGHLKESLNDDQRQMLLRQKESRTDDELYFYIRLDKDRWLDEKRIFITDSGNCYHIRIHLAAFPKTKEKALKIVEEWLN